MRKVIKIERTTPIRITPPDDAGVLFQSTTETPIPLWHGDSVDLTFEQEIEPGTYVQLVVRIECDDPRES